MSAVHLYTNLESRRLTRHNSIAFRRAKYELMHTVRTHLGAKDDAYSCIFQMEDQERNIGVRLTKVTATGNVFLCM